MKYVREHINEKFTDEGDPIHDMGIGIEEQIKKFMKNVVEEYINDDESLNHYNMLLHSFLYEKRNFIDYLIKQYNLNVHNIVEDLVNYIYEFHSTRAIYKLLVEYGVTIKEIGMKPLYYACKHGHRDDVINFFIEQGADISAAENKCLMLACKYGHLDIVKILVNAGANIFAKHCIWLANDGMHYEIVNYIKRERNRQRIEKVKKFFHLKENLNEKFTDYSDPIKDLGIGSKFARIKRGDIIVLKCNISLNNDNLIFEKTTNTYFQKGYAATVSKVTKNNDSQTLTLKLIFVDNANEAKRTQRRIMSNPSNERGYMFTYGTASIFRWNEFFNVIEYKY